MTSLSLDITNEKQSKLYKDWQQAKEKAVRISWQSGDKKAYWDAQLEEARAEFQMMMEQQEVRLLKKLNQCEKMILDYQQIVSQDHSCIKTLMECVASLMRLQNDKQG